MRGAYKLMTQLHYPTDIISHHNIAAGELTRYRVLLLPLSRHLRPETAQRIAEFVRAGGILIAEYQAGRFDQFHRETDSLRGLLGGKSLGTTDAFKSFDAGDDKGIRLYAPITKETPFGWRHRPNVEPIDRGRKNRRRRRCGNTGPLPGRSPAAIERTAGRGRGALLCRDLLHSYRNYFYTLNTLPNPATRGNEIINVGDPAYRQAAPRIPRPLRSASADAAGARFRRCRNGRFAIPDSLPLRQCGVHSLRHRPTGGRTSGMRLHSKRMSHLKSGGSL